MSTTESTEPSEDGGRRPTGWMIATAVAALIAIGLGAWALSLQSDKDDLQDEVTTLEQQGTAAAQQADARFKNARAQYAKAMQALGVTATTLEQSEAQLKQLQSEAQTAAQAAQGAAADLEAQVAAAKSETSLYQACLGAAVAVLEKPYTDLDSGSVAEQSASELNTVAAYCKG